MDPAARIAALVEADAEPLPLGWVRKRILPALKTALEIIDAVPLRVDTHLQWMRAKAAIVEAQHDIEFIIQAAVSITSNNICHMKYTLLKCQQSPRKRPAVKTPKPKGGPHTCAPDSSTTPTLNGSSAPTHARHTNQHWAIVIELQFESSGSIAINVVEALFRVA